MPARETVCVVDHHPETLTKPVVYVVDDDEAVLRSLCRLLTVGGYEPKPYNRPASFLQEYAPEESAACIVLDITMQGMTGLQVQAELKARRISAPVIVVSARTDESTRRKASELGAHSFLSKPVHSESLFDAIAKAMRHQRNGA